MSAPTSLSKKFEKTILRLFDLTVLLVVAFGGYRLSRCGGNGTGAMLAKVAGLYALGVATVFAVRWLVIRIFRSTIVRTYLGTLMGKNYEPSTVIGLFLCVWVLPYAVFLAAVMFLTRCG